jgi:two-component system, chemotaxis family, protein-glutamate methylesterase/glutaminase
MIKVLVVDDSPSVREFLSHILGANEDMQVIGASCNGEDAVEFLKHHKADVVTMDVHMPKMDGFEATQAIMETNPTPIVIATGSSAGEETPLIFRAIEAGALAVIRRPPGTGHQEHEASVREFIQTVRLMSEVKVIRRWARQPGTKEEGRRTADKDAPRLRVQRAWSHFDPRGAQVPPADIRVVAIGASTGGPLALQTILSGLPGDFPVPILIVQHMASGFMRGMVDWLSQSSGIPLHMAADGEEIMPGHAYFAPEGVNMGIRHAGRLFFEKGGPRNGAIPSVSYLFHTVLDIYGENAVGILLSGMGKDGAEELRLLKEKGAVTIAQDEESSAVFGMPGEAVRLSGATYVLPPGEIAVALAGLLRRG